MDLLGTGMRSKSPVFGTTAKISEALPTIFLGIAPARVQKSG
jgi:hypothetical protein